MYFVAKYLSEFLLSQIVSLESSSRNLLVDWRSMLVCARSSGIVAVLQLAHTFFPTETKKDDELHTKKPSQMLRAVNVKRAFISVVA